MLGLYDMVGEVDGTSDPSSDGTFEPYTVGLDEDVGTDDGAVDPKVDGPTLGKADGAWE